LISLLSSFILSIGGGWQWWGIKKNLTTARENQMVFYLSPRTRRSFHLVFVLFLTVLGFLGGCAVNPVTGQRELMLVSQDQEIRMGRELYPTALWTGEGGGGEYKDEKAKSYLGGVISRIQQASHRPDLPNTFVIQNSSVPNAWAIPGHVAITRGLLASLDNEAEFAFVMGHEVGHVSARHSARHQTYGILLQIGLAAGGMAIGDKDYGDVALGLGALGGGLLLRKTSRTDELEADRLGVLYMSRLGYDLRNAVSAHRNLQKASDEYLRSLGKEPQERGFFEELLATHPRTQLRIEEIQNLIAQTPRSPVTGDGTNREIFQKAVAGLRDTDRVYREFYDPAVRAFQKERLDEADGLLEKALRLNNQQAPFYALKGFISVKTKNFPEAERHFDRALALDRDYQPAVKGLGILHFQKKNYGQSINYLKQSLRLFPEDAASHQVLGLDYFMTRSYREAIPHLEAFAQASPGHPAVHGILGICYEQVGDRSAAYRAYQRQVQVNPKSELGRQSADRVRVLQPAAEGSKTPKR
jgi:predicted Zn-dependent protease